MWLMVSTCYVQRGQGEAERVNRHLTAAWRSRVTRTTGNEGSSVPAET